MKSSLASHPRRPGRRIAYVRLAALSAFVGVAVLAGCGDRPPEPSVEEGTVSPTEGPSAADGTDYTACEDGECEVAVAEPVEITVGAMTLSITAVTEDGIEFDLVQESGSSGGSLGGVCEATMTERSMSSACYLGGELSAPDPGAGELVVQLLGMNDGAAVLRMAAG
jgi:hypothetical protein